MQIPMTRPRGTQIIKLAFDLAIWSVVGALAFFLRSPENLESLATTAFVYILLGLPVKALAAWASGIEVRSWRHTSTQDLLFLVGALGSATLIMFSIGLLLHEWGPMGFPRTVPLIEGALAICALAGIRILRRLSYERPIRTPSQSERSEARRFLLIGAGDAGGRMAREIHRRRASGRQAVGFLDDDPAKQGLLVGGVGVLGPIEALPRIVGEVEADEVLITMPSAPGETTRRVVELAREANVASRTLPDLSELLNGRIRFSRLRKVRVEDLLRREPIELELPAEYVEGRRVLVTGAGGSIGSELIRQLAQLRPTQAVLFGHGETSLHALDLELGHALPMLDRVIVVGDIRDRVKVTMMMEQYRPDVVFHAAAHKHVPLMEGHLDEAILNNVGGTLNVAEAARLAGIRRFVNISTDKAVNPTSAVGITKSIAERIVREVGEKAKDPQVFVSVRFGNVLGSRGSVVPAFEEQIRRGGPITVTHAEMTRYFMTIPEAARLVIQTGAIGRNGAVYVLDMGTPVNIASLAQEMIRLSGAEAEGIEIVFTGLRPGEKMHEQLFASDEQIVPSGFPNILSAETIPPPEETFAADVERLLDAADARDHAAMGSLLRSLVPDTQLHASPASSDLPDQD